MTKALFDNLIKILEVRTLFTGATGVSTEIDFELPRGFVAKIKRVSLEVRGIAADIATISVDKLLSYIVGLILDPDDITTTFPPTNVVSHDALESLQVDVLVVAGTAGDPGVYISFLRKEVNYESEGLDVITARNMRQNIDITGTDAADGTEAIAVTTIHYTLEKITDVDILSLLDIL